MHSPLSEQDNSSMAPKVAEMFRAKDHLPERLRVLFELLFVTGMTEEQAANHLHVDVAAIEIDKSTMLKSLKSVCA